MHQQGRARPASGRAAVIDGALRQVVLHHAMQCGEGAGAAVHVTHGVHAPPRFEIVQHRRQRRFRRVRFSGFEFEVVVVFAIVDGKDPDVLVLQFEIRVGRRIVQPAVLVVDLVERVVIELVIPRHR